MGGRSKTRLNRKDEETLIRTYLKRGHTQKEIAQALGLTASTVRVVMRGMGMVDPTRIAAGLKAKETAAAKQI